MNIFNLTASKASGQHQGANIVDAVILMAAAIDNLATQVKYLGTGNAGTTMGAIEFLGTHLAESLDGIAGAIRDAGERSE